MDQTIKPWLWFNVVSVSVQIVWYMSKSLLCKSTMHNILNAAGMAVTLSQK